VKIFLKAFLNLRILKKCSQILGLIKKKIKKNRIRNKIYLLPLALIILSTRKIRFANSLPALMT